MENKNTPKFIGGFILICLVLGIILTYSQMQSTTLQGYVGDNTSIVVTVAPYAVATAAPDTTTYQDDMTNIQISVPIGWTKVIKNGCTTFIHNGTDASYVQLQRVNYTPGMNNMTEQQLRQELSAMPNTAFVSFTSYGNSGYMVMYQTQVDSIVYDYIEINKIDRQYIARVQFCVPDSYYTALETDIGVIADSVVWQATDPMPDDYMILYNDFGTFEFAVPIGWEHGAVNGEYVAVEPKSGATLYTSVVASNATYENVTQAKYAEYMGTGKTGFSVKEFSSSANIVYAISAYEVNGVQVYRVEYMLATGYYEYAMSFICPVSYYQALGSVFQQIVYYFRTF